MHGLHGLHGAHAVKPGLSGLIDLRGRQRRMQHEGVCRRRFHVEECRRRVASRQMGCHFIGHCIGFECFLALLLFDKILVSDGPGDGHFVQHEALLFNGAQVDLLAIVLVCPFGAFVAEVVVRGQGVPAVRELVAQHRVDVRVQMQHLSPLPIFHRGDANSGAPCRQHNGVGLASHRLLHLTSDDPFILVQHHTDIMAVIRHAVCLHHMNLFLLGVLHDVVERRVAIADHQHLHTLTFQGFVV
mmetsp:Transcript_924/g.1878  ORF Transcript_924/g.1878 Transcript_924/m.1878 type:complete len:243 (-) Transcript_924:925-1653(-)